uniref:Cytochrome P450 n=1 Tax=Chromera velia CCMP2878 TaxID=1169474 RepID=A0A0G4HQZ1_9ALVE|eukprot:Cvel_7998.t1-p1 / transcript=Cvel_7998.t1 / gene=Cvel_7998 / organism=Chromera_velia_CCMP2878 / gene_product=Cytochrome P450 4d2, putative / transcript_product=Cytochrome P450 4d2, putative / location=Cvel_scaffold431:15331-18360(-) / protein_length=595 / sequence_SO=supercontig / SO=protein_coding / is_pseudo=false
MSGVGRGSSVLSLSTFAFSSEWLLESLRGAVKALPKTLVLQAALLFGVSIPTAIACRWLWLIARLKLRMRGLTGLPLPFFSEADLKKKPLLKSNPLVISLDQESGGSIRCLLDCLQTTDGDGKRRWRKLVNLGSSYMNGKVCVMVYDCDFFKEATGDLERFPKEKMVYGVTKLVLGDGLVTSTGSKWAKNRKALTPLFHFNALKESSRVVEKESDVFVKSLLDKAKAKDGQEKGKEQGALVGPSDLKGLTLSVIIQASFGGAFDNVWMARAWKELLELQEPYFASGILFGPEWVSFLPLPSVYRFSQKRDRIIRKVREFVREKKQANKNAPQSKKGSGTTTTGANNLVDQLLNSGVAEETDITDEAITFLFAGHDTTSTALQWALFELSCSPKTQDWVMEEILSLATWTSSEGGGGRKEPSLHVTPDVLASLDRTRSVIREALRLWPPVPWLDRECTRDECLDGVTLPKGTHVALNVWAAARDRAVWGEDAEEFRPERLIAASEDESTRVSHYSMLPFSAGPRNCIGQKFALQEAVVVLAKLLLRFQVDLSEEYKRVAEKNEGEGSVRDKVELVFKITLEPRDVTFCLKPREWSQ